MEYRIRVRHDSGQLEDKETVHNTDSVVESDLADLHEKASKAYLDAVKNYTSAHTISLFRDNVTVHEALGTGTSALSKKSDDADAAVKFGVAPVVGVAKSDDK